MIDGPVRSSDTRRLVLQRLDDGSIRFVIVEKLGGLITGERVMGFIVVDRDRVGQVRDALTKMLESKEKEHGRVLQT